LAAGNAAAGINADLNEESSSRRGTRGNEEGASSDEEVGEGDELDAGEARLRSRHNDVAAEYEGEEGEVEEMHPDDEQEDDEDEEIISTSPLGSSELAMDDGENILMDEEQLRTMEQQRVKRQKLAVDARKQRVVQKTEHVSAYEFDERSERWCRVTFQLPLNGKCAVDVAAIVQREVDSFIVFQTTGIEKCVLVEGKTDENGQKTERDIIQTQGVNMQALYQRSHVLDVNTIYTTDVDCILRHYGIEACARAIRQEMSTVFGNYGIKVNPRHLTLVADYMTFTGVVTPFARQAMLSSASPLQKMTFETTMNFMRDAIVSGDVDYLQSPSARLVMGQVIRGGTGCFDLIVPKDFLIGQNEKKKKKTR